MLCLHWFNPLVWLSFILMTKDMEMSCDEQVLKEMGQEIKQDYSRSLLSLALSHRMIGGSPLAFGESSAKSRMKNALNYKQPTFWGMLDGAAGILILSLGLISNPESSQSASANLNLNYAAKISAAQDQLIIRVHGQGASFITGEDWRSRIIMELSDAMCVSN
nr:M56 family metallopeptidase [Desulfosporosinus sp. BICA1-9]